LSAQLGISKTPLREALIQLAAEGLVDMPSNRLKRVAPLKRRTPLENHFLYQTLRETAYRHGVGRLKAVDLDEMEQALRLQKQALNVQDWATAARQGRRFHEIVVKATDNEELYRLSRQYTHAIDRVSIMLRPASERIHNNEINLTILSAIRQGDAEMAIHRMHEQSEQLVRLLNALPDDATQSEQQTA